jgi:ArsR family transcriptional regulator, virulence genes transcriptional regulator
MSLKIAKLPKQGLTDMEAKAEEVAELLGAMANPVRLLILCALVDGEKSVTELIGKTKVSQSAVSQHLGKMRLQGLVATRRDAQTIYYRLASREVSAVLATLYAVFCKV